ncbi:peptidylprolyl isomerase [Halomonas janggokensis]|uniref:peptidylprolyl isomerase n=1 Tax=Vreelandella janggokensis TaxID=370767 RepID=A0ABT4IUH0_9GAMM|nr:MULTISPECIES: peptidylprolyl isomerase [Halomonas]MCW4148115.1 peptidylprolyl isomerase [Halomonas sp. 18H]MCZ0926632.1 peptidylprolyl isomerase [Halomonas janggokensis]MCZ0929170.1 peptidylprolyl isomerase [Halomonas janggokensis]
MQMIDIEQLPGEATTPAVSVGGQPILDSDIAQEMQYHPADSAGSAQLNAARALVVRELLRQRATELGLLQEGDDADDQAVAALLEQELAVPEPSEEDCERFYATHPERFCEPTRVSVRHILLAAAPDDAEARDAQYHQGVTLLETLRQHPERLTEFAQRYSACPSNEQGGELGWLVPGQTVAELDRALQHLPEGLHDRPLASRYGWHLVMVDAREEGRQLAYNDVADRVRLSLHEQATRRGLRHYLLALEADIGVEGVALDDDSGDSLMQ